jgi:hypothetical protein
MMSPCSRRYDRKPSSIPEKASGKLIGGCGRKVKRGIINGYTGFTGIWD